MNHLLILYNPCYQQDVIQQHLSVLQEKSQVGFGKIRSKLNDQEKQDSLEEVYKATSEENFLQLFLTDYANLFVAKVIKVSKDIDESLIPSYYKEKKIGSGRLFYYQRFKGISQGRLQPFKGSIFSQFHRAKQPHLRHLWE